MKGTIELKGMEFFTCVGCLPEEKIKANHIVVDFRCEYDLAAAACTDRLEDTLDYAAVYEIVRAQASVPCNLLENLAGRIAAEIRDSFPGMKHFMVKVSKENPPVTGKAAWSSVTMEQ